MTNRIFSGKWITTEEFADLKPRNVYFRQLERKYLSCTEHRNRHILFRKRFVLQQKPKKALLYVTADDYYKLYVNGQFVTQGPSPAYPTCYNYNTVDITAYLSDGDNLLAFHTLYQGLINRVWVSGDQMHGMLCDLVADGVTVVQSDDTFRVRLHSGYKEAGTVGYDTQFLENYDSNAAEVGFENLDFDDSDWEYALPRISAPYRTVPQLSEPLVFESILPITREQREQVLFLDFGATYVGYLNVEAVGVQGSEIEVRCGQELWEDGSLRYEMRAGCVYCEKWHLSGKSDRLEWFDYKAFRYAEIVLPEDCEVKSVSLNARHYPFTLRAEMNPHFAQKKCLRAVWNLCVNSQKYGVQETVMDCMDREKGFYMGDGCYTALTNIVLTGNDSMVRKLIDDSLHSSFISDSLMTCLDCSFMQEIAEFPLMLVFLILWHYRLMGDRDYLARCFPKVCTMLESFRIKYEKDGLLQNIDRWCVVEWPSSFRDGYDVDLTEGTVCCEPHIALNAYYIEAIRSANIIAAELKLPHYRDASQVIEAFTAAFYDPTQKLFKDSDRTTHISYIGNILAYAFRLYPENTCRDKIELWIAERGISAVSMFGSFPMLWGLIRHNRMDLVESCLEDPNSWSRMLREGATTTFEGWGKDTKRNTSLFHLTLSHAAIFLSNNNLKELLL